MSKEVLPVKTLQFNTLGGTKGFDFNAGGPKKEGIEVSREISEKAQKSLITRLPAGRQGV